MATFTRSQSAGNTSTAWYAPNPHSRLSLCSSSHEMPSRQRPPSRDVRPIDNRASTGPVSEYTCTRKSRERNTLITPPGGGPLRRHSSSGTSLSVAGHFSFSIASFRRWARVVVIGIAVGLSFVSQRRFPCLIKFLHGGFRGVPEPCNAVLQVVSV